MKRLIVPVVAAALMAVAATSAPVNARGAGDGSVSQVGGWTGDQPRPVGLSVSSEGRLTAGFTTTDGPTSTLWTADRPTGRPWDDATEVASGVDAVSAQFAGNEAGAAVAAWDAPDVGGGATLWVSVRPSTATAWSAPTAVVTDQLPAHQPSVGIDSTGTVTAAYLHETSGAVAVSTRRYDGTSWDEPLQHSTAPAVQVRMRVAESGYVTLAWSQVEPGAAPASESTGNATLYSRRYVAPSGTWAAPVELGDSLPPTGIVDLAVNANDLASMVYYERTAGRVFVTLARSRNGFGTDPCWPQCPNQWLQTLDGADPVQTVSVDDAADVQTFLAARREELDGSHTIITAQDNGTFFGPGTTVSAAGDVGQPQIARADGQPGHADRVGVSWVTHTADGDVLALRGERVPAGDDPRVDTAATTFGRTSAPSAMVVEPWGDIDLLWADAASGTLRLSTVSVTEPLAPTRVYAQTTAVPVAWSTTTQPGAAARVDVRVRQATARRGFGSWATWRSVTRTATTFRSLQGRTLCLATRVQPSDARSGPWSRERCTTTAVNDTALTGRGWRTHRSRTYYGRSLRASARRGASLSVANVRAKSIALLVSRRPAAGRVRVSFDGRAIATVSTAGRRGDKVVVPVVTFPTGRRGDLTITVVSRGRPVNLDGVFVSAR